MTYLSFKNDNAKSVMKKKMKRKKVHQSSTIDPHKECVCLSLIARVNYFYFLN
jgi:hypothetical protein